MKDTPVDNLEQRVAKALRDEDPTPMSMFDDEDLKALAQAAINAVREWDKEQASDLLKSIRRIARSALSGSVPPYDALERIEDTLMEAIGQIPPSIPNPQVHN